MTEPVIGARVRFASGGKHLVGDVVGVLTVGREGKTGLFRLRRRAQIHFEDEGQRWETLRDLDAFVVIEDDLLSPLGTGRHV